LKTATDAALLRLNFRRICLIGELKPLRDEWVQEDVKAVDMAPWKHARAISAVLVLIVLTIYVVFADLSVLS
jgi:SSS family solute:Na+ symporter